ncbi:hypothetical protein [Devosia sp. A449]
MKKLTATLAAALIVGGLAPSVMASEDRTFDADFAKTLITYGGSDVDRVEEWGGYVRAFMNDGSMAFFDQDTLKPVQLR